MSNAEKLSNVLRKIERLDSDATEIDRKRRKLVEQTHGLREKIAGLVPGETILREVHSGIVPSTKRGVFVGFYSRLATGSDWVKVRRFKKNGEPGLREQTFYRWEKVEDQS